MRESIVQYYLAASLKNIEGHNQVRDALTSRGYQITYDWTAHGSLKDEGPEALRTAAVEEIRGVQQAQFVLALLPAGRGTHVEIGAALGAGIPVVAFTAEREKHLGAGPGTSAFYHHPGVTMMEWPLCGPETAAELADAWWRLAVPEKSRPLRTYRVTWKSGHSGSRTWDDYRGRSAAEVRAQVEHVLKTGPFCDTGAVVLSVVDLGAVEKPTQ